MRKIANFPVEFVVVCCDIGTDLNLNQPPVRRLFAFAFLLLALASCTSSEKKLNRGLAKAEGGEYYVDTLTSALQNPWGMAFLPDGRMLITERGGSIRIMKDDVLLPDTLTGVPAVLAKGQGGLLDIQLHPDYATNGWIYFSFSKPVQNDTTSATVIARAKINGNTLTDVQELFQAKDPATTFHHFGSRIQFDGNGYMFFSSGERGTKENSQNLGNHLGKILRLHDDGKVPTDNPFVNVAGALPEIWSYGHRNPQGLYFDKETGTLWEHEHGPKGGDELNIVVKGKNYGWPVITYGINYDGTIITEEKAKEGMEQPVHYWVPSIGPCGMERVTSDRYPAWKGNFLIGSLSFQFLSRVQVDGQQFVKEERLLEKIGRVRAIRQSPDGFLYVASEMPGKILKLVPKQ
ncbi:MAG: PQQ-dependent sugar dehydrogenase [Cyclobacteriaceae bacterium]|nr:PQQ-dependent sugar dehydrogenase [Cyclobacteriaceae bacterium]